MTEHLWLDGRLWPVTDAALNIRHARALIAGRGVYETMRVANGAPARFAAHMQRLSEGTRRLGLAMPDADEVRDAVAALVAANSLTHARVRLDVVRGEDGATVALMAASPLAPLPGEQSLYTVPWRRNEHSPLAGIKYSACPENALALEAARTAGCDEALFLNTRGEVCEGAFCNVFAVIEGTVTTPPLDSGCLPGITREVVLALCRGAGIPCEERAMQPGELHAPGCTGMFLTSSIRGVMPVSRVDARTFSAGDPVTAAVKELCGL